MSRKRVKAAAPLKTAKAVSWKGKEYDVDAFAAKWLTKLEAAFERYQSTRARNAVYEYLEAVYAIAVGFDAPSDRKRVAARMARMKEFVVRRGQDRFSLLIRASSTVDEKTRWKWSRCLAYAWSEEVKPRDLETFIRGLNGINDCATKLSRT